MSTFDIRSDAPGLLRAESLNITIKFDRTSDTTGRISWNIPTPAAGCTAGTQAYCGMVVTLDTTPTSSVKLPTQGTVYQDDPTGDINLHAGDKIGTSLVVGAFYQDLTTTFFDITGLKPNTPYYISGFPADCQLRYFSEGVHAYSLDYQRQAGTSTPSTQVVQLDGTTGVALTDFTGLMPGVNYSFTMDFGGIRPRRTRPASPQDCDTGAPMRYTITIDGVNAQTYQDLINELNRQFGLLTDCPRGPLPPNTGSYLWTDETRQLSQWDGTQYVPIAVIAQPTSPDTVPTGTYWVDSSSDNALSIWNGASWDAVSTINLSYDPADPPGDTSYWYDGIEGYTWNGNTWCLTLLYTSAADPGLGSQPPSGSFWFNTTEGELFRWNDKLGIWVASSAIEYDTDPNLLPTGTLWFNSTSFTLYAYDTLIPDWVEQTNVAIAETAPTTPAPGKYWYKPTTQQLFQRDIGNTTWVEQNYILYPEDPRSRVSCDVWWDTTTDTLHQWDVSRSVWVDVSNFYQQTTDPSLPPSIDDGTLWFNTTNNTLNVWSNNCFLPVEFINWPVNPVTDLPPGTAWYDTVNRTWSIRNSINDTWMPIDPTISSSDPTNLPTGTFWYDTGFGGLYQWNGIAWVSLLYTTTPQTPAKGACWFDTSINQVRTWDGSAWVIAPSTAYVELNCHGNLIFSDTMTGSLSMITVDDVTLFKSLTVPFTVLDPVQGTDGLSAQPSYAEVGIGTDGSADERRQLMSDIRHELGYPVVDVELTQDQLDFAITKALEELRSRSGVAYKTGFFFMHVNSNTQRYLLTNKTQEFDTIVQILGVYRLTSSFLSSAHGAGVYGQIVLQHLYNMGTFDLLSYHIMAEYTKLMEILFAGRITYSWNEQKRELWIHHRFPFNERMVLIEAACERTEQDIMSDRWCKTWVRRYATARARLMLAEIRGKYSSLPGANGSLTLNASDLRMSANDDITQCMKDLEDYINDRPEDYGMGSTFLFG